MTLESRSIETLVAEANIGDAEAWNAIVDRYASLVWSICLGFRLPQADAADVSQTVWLRAVEKLATIRVPAALPGWLATTTRRECIKVSKARSTGPWELTDFTVERDADVEVSAVDTELLAAERRAMVREGFAQLPEHCQRLLALLVGSEPRSYAEISSRLEIPVGSIGPTRSRCLEKLRACPSVALWMQSQSDEEPGDEPHV